MLDRKILHVRHSHLPNILYHDGCILCDLIESLHSHVAEVPSLVPWLTNEDAALQDIRAIKKFYFNVEFHIDEDVPPEKVFGFLKSLQDEVKNQGGELRLQQ